MEQLPPPPTDIKLLVENALLHNNEQLRSGFEASLEKFSIKMSADINKQTKAFADQVFALTSKVATHEGEIGTLKGSLGTLKEAINALKIRMAVVGSTCTVLGGLVGFFIAQIVK